jgi:hypothetical protein
MWPSLKLIETIGNSPNARDSSVPMWKVSANEPSLLSRARRKLMASNRMCSRGMHAVNWAEYSSHIPLDI